MAQSRSSRKIRGVSSVPVPESRTVTTWLGGSFVLTLGALLFLIALRVPLGQGYFFYRYSPLRELRTIRVLPCLLIAAPAIGALGLVSLRRTSGAVVLLALVVAETLWIIWAPPRPVAQHSFNLSSLSSDGAFVMDAELTPSLIGYLRHFNQRLGSSPAQLGGTRILSNPPGGTAPAYGVF